MNEAGLMCTDAGPATGSPTQLHAPKQRREGRECVLHDGGAVRMCSCRGFEQLNVTANPKYSISKGLVLRALALDGAVGAVQPHLLERRLCRLPLPALVVRGENYTAGCR
jgi:hypothetical protein